MIPANELVIVPVCVYVDEEDITVWWRGGGQGWVGSHCSIIRGYKVYSVSKKVFPLFKIQQGFSLIVCLHIDRHG